MLDVSLIRNDPEKVRKALHVRDIKEQLVDDFLALDERWRTLTKALDDARRSLNELSNARNIEAARTVKEQVKQLEAQGREMERERNAHLDRFPNIPAEGVPVGKDDSANTMI